MNTQPRRRAEFDVYATKPRRRSHDVPGYLTSAEKRRRMKDAPKRNRQLVQRAARMDAVDVEWF